MTKEEWMNKIIVSYSTKYLIQIVCDSEKYRNRNWEIFEIVNLEKTCVEYGLPFYQNFSSNNLTFPEVDTSST